MSSQIEPYYMTSLTAGTVKKEDTLKTRPCLTRNVFLNPFA